MRLFWMRVLPQCGRKCILSLQISSNYSWLNELTPLLTLLSKCDSHVTALHLRLHKAPFFARKIQNQNVCGIKSKSCIQWGAKHLKGQTKEKLSSNFYICNLFHDTLFQPNIKKIRIQITTSANKDVTCNHLMGGRKNAKMVMS